MASHAHKHVDGLYYRYDFKTGRNKLPIELKAVRRNITLSPSLDREAEAWKQRTGMTFSAWVELKMIETIHTETV
mgnify:FL=1